MTTFNDTDDLMIMNEMERSSTETAKTADIHDEAHTKDCILGKSSNDAMDSGIDENLSDKSPDDGQGSDSTSGVTTSVNDVQADDRTRTMDAENKLKQENELDVTDNATNSDSEEDIDIEHEMFKKFKFTAHRDSRTHASVGSSVSDNKPYSAMRATPKVYEPVKEEEPEDEMVRKIRRRTSVKPPDGGWGWVVVAGSFIAFFLGGGLSRSFTLIYQHMLVVFGQSAAATSATAALFGSVKMCSSPIVGMLCTKFSKRKVAVVGGVITSVAMVMTSFPISLTYIYFTYGVLAAFGMNMILTPIFIIISEYFKKRRARAMSLAMLGASFGGIGLPPLINFLFDSYNYSGAMLILAGLMFHLCLAGSVFRSVRHSRMKTKTDENENAALDEDLGDDDDDDELPESGDDEPPGPDDDQRSFHRNSAKRGSTLGYDIKKDEIITLNLQRTSSLKLQLGNGRGDSISLCLPRSTSLKLQYDDCRDGSIGIPPSQCSFKDDISCGSGTRKVSSVVTFGGESRNESEAPDYPEGLGPQYLSHYRRIARLAKRQVSFQLDGLRLPMYKEESISDVEFDRMDETNSNPCMKRWHKFLDQIGIHLFRQPRFVFYSILMMCSILSLSISGTFLAGLVLDLGFGETHTGIMLSASAVGAIPSKSISGIVFDLKKARPHRSLLLCGLGFLTGSFAVIMGFCKGYIELFVIYVIYSFFASSYHCHQSTVLADIVRTRDVSRAMGMCRLFQGIGFIIGPTLGGYIKDVTGHYKNTFIFSGSVLVTCTLLYTCMDVWLVWKMKLRQKRTIPKSYVARCRADSIWSNI